MQGSTNEGLASVTVASSKLMLRQSIEERYRSLHGAVHARRGFKGGPLIDAEAPEVHMPLIGSIVQQLLESGDVHGATHHSGTLGGFLRGGLGRVGLKV